MPASKTLQTRREALAAIGASITALVAPGGHLAQSSLRDATVRGRVLDTTDAAAAHGASRGIPGVMVSNGRDVAVTDAEGRYALPARPGEPVFVIKPAHWAYEQRSGIPSFYRLDEEAAVPPASLDFGLHRAAEPEDFDVLLYADTQAADVHELGYVRDVLMASAPDSGAAFAINHGDVVGDDLSLLRPYRRLLDDTGLIWHHCPGNHDMNRDAGDQRLAFATWRREIGPTHYAFQYGKATFILLNNVEATAAKIPERHGRRYRGHFGAEQLEFVENVLRNVPETGLVVVSMHIPLVSYADPLSPSDTTDDRRALMTLLGGRPHTISFAGHSHTTEHHYLGHADGFHGVRPHHHHVLTAACGSWWGGPPDAHGIPTAHSRDGSPKGYHVLEVRGTEACTRFVALSPGQPWQARTLVADAELAPGASSGRLVVNVFDGGPRTSVHYRIGNLNLEPRELSRTSRKDPFIVDAFSRDRSMYRSWVAPAPSSHLWQADLPAGLPPGEHELVVTICGEYGRTIEHKQVLSIPVAS